MKNFLVVGGSGYVGSQIRSASDVQTTSIDVIGSGPLATYAVTDRGIPLHFAVHPNFLRRSDFERDVILKRGGGLARAVDALWLTHVPRRPVQGSCFAQQGQFG